MHNNGLKTTEQPAGVNEEENTESNYAVIAHDNSSTDTDSVDESPQAASTATTDSAEDSPTHAADTSTRNVEPSSPDVTTHIDQASGGTASSDPVVRRKSPKTHGAGGGPVITDANSKNLGAPIITQYTKSFRASRSSVRPGYADSSQSDKITTERRGRTQSLGSYKATAVTKGTSSDAKCSLRTQHSKSSRTYIRRRRASSCGAASAPSSLASSVSNFSFNLETSPSVFAEECNPPQRSNSNRGVWNRIRKAFAQCFQICRKRDTSAKDPAVAEHTLEGDNLESLGAGASRNSCASTLTLNLDGARPGAHLTPGTIIARASHSALHGYGTTDIAVLIQYLSINFEDLRQEIRDPSIDTDLSQLDLLEATINSVACINVKSIHKHGASNTKHRIKCRNAFCSILTHLLQLLSTELKKKTCREEVIKKLAVSITTTCNCMCALGEEEVPKRKQKTDPDADTAAAALQRALSFAAYVLLDMANAASEVHAKFIPIAGIFSALSGVVSAQNSLEYKELVKYTVTAAINYSIDVFRSNVKKNPRKGRVRHVKYVVCDTPFMILSTLVGYTYGDTGCSPAVLEALKANSHYTAVVALETIFYMEAARELYRSECKATKCKAFKRFDESIQRCISTADDAFVDVVDCVNSPAGLRQGVVTKILRGLDSVARTIGCMKADCSSLPLTAQCLNKAYICSIRTSEILDPYRVPTPNIWDAKSLPLLPGEMPNRRSMAHNRLSSSAAAPPVPARSPMSRHPSVQLFHTATSQISGPSRDTEAANYMMPTEPSVREEQQAFFLDAAELQTLSINPDVSVRNIRIRNQTPSTILFNVTLVRDAEELTVDLWPSVRGNP
ncbi:hypothetical protein [Anaplasma phagocytophilum]|uniref:Uncharacterized protein n=1 Tax=Anaplasma phagocytophilum str. ApWI1 TaxID=1359155 RepID=A0A0F3PYR9_ANAPH|nr:hypothetical protein [Anaplasma phagocytophilum]KJZ98671.1 hypothetical protein APHCR_0314 [Anaplasma phagocytophilum str. CR1007]AGR80735.1 hypothetical protein WSQ_03765 [Anaplasma phagocytophilum str. JM]AGR81987.1 hypothetical protein YYY_03755 [Anaplasma phagocytophilum str. Dog2]EOA61090.1 hypothetical protein HGE1_03502 [Anaplasma phagocytophilum str. HGE1]KJV60327.1 hypothetical protein APHWEB_1206 [Anaplasma phagocytophilum str. Webster]